MESLNAVTSTDTDTQVAVSLDKMPTGGGTYVYVLGRKVAGVGDYRAKIRVLASGQVNIAISRFSGTTEVAAAPETKVDGLTYVAGQKLRFASSPVASRRPNCAPRSGLPVPPSLRRGRWRPPTPPRHCRSPEQSLLRTTWPPLHQCTSGLVLPVVEGLPSCACGARGAGQQGGSDAIGQIAVTHLRLLAVSNRAASMVRSGRLRPDRPSRCAPENGQAATHPDVSRGQRAPSTGREWVHPDRRSHVTIAR